MAALIGNIIVLDLPGAKSDPLFRELGFRHCSSSEEMLGALASAAQGALVIVKWVPQLAAISISDLCQAHPDAAIIVVGESRDRDQIYAALGSSGYFAFLPRPLSKKRIYELIADLELKRHKADEVQEERRALRYPIEMIVKEQSNLFLPPIITKDVSESGISLSVRMLIKPTKIILGRQVELEVTVLGEQRKGLLKGTVRWYEEDLQSALRDSYLVGIHIPSFDAQLLESIRTQLDKHKYLLLLVGPDQAMLQQLAQAAGSSFYVLQAADFKTAKKIATKTPVQAVVVANQDNTAENLKFLNTIKLLGEDTFRVWCGQSADSASLVSLFNQCQFDHFISMDRPEHFAQAFKDVLKVMDSRLADTMKSRDRSIQEQPSNAALFPQRREVQNKYAIALALMVSRCSSEQIGPSEELDMLVNTTLMEARNIILDNGGDCFDLPLHAKIGIFLCSSGDQQMHALKAACQIRDYALASLGSLMQPRFCIGIGMDGGHVSVARTAYAEECSHLVDGQALHKALMLASMVNTTNIVSTEEVFQPIKDCVHVSPLIVRGKSELQNLYTIKGLHSH